ncbi:TetR/AcrR family transcriptional regulator [Nitratireductor sp. StC3]|uniref:TetR/AcrR family transcriptional regulator n=1 Tax=Nitratireductor sp. StC3 TaxID=2126741 RepID=UPI001304A2E3|nr:TetR/AcrR family transcriptional regulator [Nitratireductor sp. StC3]
MDDEAPDVASDDAPATVTEKIEKAVLDLLEDQGVLAGINLNDVARKAQVTRGLVYHHFGDRRGLLRSAIRRRMAASNAAKTTPKKPMPLDERIVHALVATQNAVDTLKLTTLLHLDGSTAPTLMPNAEATLLLLQRDLALGLIQETDDLEALHAIYAALVYGYTLYREVFARDLGLDANDLDKRLQDEIRNIFNK